MGDDGDRVGAPTGGPPSGRRHVRWTSVEPHERRSRSATAAAGPVQRRLTRLTHCTASSAPNTATVLLRSGAHRRPARFTGGGRERNATAAGGKCACLSCRRRTGRPLVLLQRGGQPAAQRHAHFQSSCSKEKKHPPSAAAHPPARATPAGRRRRARRPGRWRQWPRWRRPSCQTPPNLEGESTQVRTHNGERKGERFQVVVRSQAGMRSSGWLHNSAAAPSWRPHVPSCRAAAQQRCGWPSTTAASQRCPACTRACARVRELDARLPHEDRCGHRQCKPELEEQQLQPGGGGGRVALHLHWHSIKGRVSAVLFGMRCYRGALPRVPAAVVTRVVLLLMYSTLSTTLSCASSQM